MNNRDKKQFDILIKNMQIDLNYKTTSDFLDFINNRENEKEMDSLVEYAVKVTALEIVED
jgi:hypothetical protein